MCSARRLVALAALFAAMTAPGLAQAQTSGASASNQTRPTWTLAPNAQDLLRAPEGPREASNERRPGLLTSMYVLQGALQVADFTSTYEGIELGAREMNPLIANGNRGTTIALKAATGAATIWVVERMRKRSKKAAIVTMIAINAGMTAVVVNNRRAIDRLR